MEDTPAWLSRRDAVRLFGIPHRQLTELVRSGVIRSAKLGNCRGGYAVAVYGAFAPCSFFA
jgi:hypothetical protein